MPPLLLRFNFSHSKFFLVCWYHCINEIVPTKKCGRVQRHGTKEWIKERRDLDRLQTTGRRLEQLNLQVIEGFSGKRLYLAVQLQNVVASLKGGIALDLRGRSFRYTVTIES